MPGASGRELAIDGPLGRPSLRSGSSTSRVSYDVAIRYTTDQLGAMLERLDDEVFDNTLIIVTSDHGEEIFDHQGFGHSYTLFEEVVRVPLLVKAAGQKTAHVHSEIVSLVDIYPTVLEATAMRPGRSSRAARWQSTAAAGGLGSWRAPIGRCSSMSIGWAAPSDSLYCWSPTS